MHRPGNAGSDALETVRDQVAAASGITDSGDPADTGRIGSVLDSLLPTPVQRPQGQMRHLPLLHRDDGRPQATTVITRVRITILVPQPDRPAARSRARKNDPSELRPRQPRPDTRRDKITQIMPVNPDATVQDANSSGQLGIRPLNMLTPAINGPTRRREPNATGCGSLPWSSVSYAAAATCGCAWPPAGPLGQPDHHCPRPAARPSHPADRSKRPLRPGRNDQGP